ncbi:class I SAM-dependent methyltransferase [Falsiroseomonas sp.]|uniref:class I SAM-dependent methyltransferase n=1 Tax=Falsiroseomonas sp. TaxID=2870721 RepID=UPI0035636EA2
MSETPAGGPAHWDAAYAQGAETRSWFQAEAAPSLRLIEAAGADPAAPLLDAGGGASKLVDALLAQGFADITVADLSPAAMAISRKRLGAAAAKVTWIEADLARWTPPRRYALWHDRAAFHFLTDDAAQEGYLAALRAGTLPGAAVIIAAFAPDGPERCSGLPVRRWSPQDLAARIGPPFALEHAEAEIHRTPAGGEQRFAWTLLRRQG